MSLLTEDCLCFRRFGKLDDLVHSIWPLLEWIATISETMPYEIVGFYEEICYPETRRFWCFNREEIVARHEAITERDVTPTLYEDVEQLRQEIVELLPNRDD